LRWALVLALFATGLLSCAPNQVRQRPAAPLEVRADNHSVAIDEVIVKGAPTALVVKTRIRLRGTLSVARLATDSARPCAGAGPEASVIELDGSTLWTRPIALDGGEHQVGFAFPRLDIIGPKIVSGAGFLDLAVTGSDLPACLRVPLAGGAVAWHKTSAWSAGGNIGFYPPFGIGGSVGRWVGPVRFGVDLGVASIVCRDCRRVATLLVPASLTAEAYLPSRSGPTLGLKLGYDAVPGLGFGHPRAIDFRHGPSAALKLAIVQPATGFDHGPAMLTWYLAGTAAFWGQGAPFSGPRMLGIAIGWDHGL
jgi:hypothetical protein